MYSLKLSKYVERVCPKCTLPCETIVRGYGNYKYRVVFIGEAPGAEEHKLGKPFVGRSGKLLTEMLNKSNIKRELVYITNIVKCRPEGNRTPTKEEKRICAFYLNREFNIVKPEIIITLGSTATSFFIGGRISDLVNKITKTKDNVYIYPMYHPSYVLRNGITKETYLNSFIRLKQVLCKIFKKLDLRFKLLIEIWGK